MWVGVPPPSPRSPSCRRSLFIALEQWPSLHPSANTLSYLPQDLISDLALAEEKIEAADQQLAADESEEAASGRDLRVLRQQLSAMRIALVEAHARLAEQEARLTSCPADEGEAGKKQVRGRDGSNGQAVSCS